MTLREINEGIGTNALAWSLPYKELLQTVPDQENVQEKMIAFINTALFDALKTGREMTPEKMTAILTSTTLGALRLGLMIGLLIDPPPGPHEDEALLHASACDACQHTGEICIKCGHSRYECQCGGGFSPVQCEICSGTGTIDDGDPKFRRKR